MTDTERMFVLGRGTFVDDLAPPGTLHLKVVRSPYARARLVRVRGGITHAELPANLSSVGEGSTGGRVLVPHPILASQSVNYVGQPVAAVLGTTAAHAEDLLPSVEVEYEPLKPVANAEAAIAAVRDDAARFVPDQLKEVDDILAQMKDNLAKQKYPAVLTAARELNRIIASVNETVATERANAAAVAAQLTERWNSLSTEIPEMVESVTARVASLAKSRKYPEGVDAASFENIKATADTMAQSWQQALGAFANNNMQEAVDMAQAAKDRGTEVMMALGMSPSG